jgi:hypothetical protein
MVLACVPKDQLRQRHAYEFFKGLDSPASPLGPQTLSSAAQRLPIRADAAAVASATMPDCAGTFGYRCWPRDAQAERHLAEQVG